MNGLLDWLQIWHYKVWYDLISGSEVIKKKLGQVFAFWEKKNIYEKKDFWKKILSPEPPTQ